MHETHCVFGIQTSAANKALRARGSQLVRRTLSAIGLIGLTLAAPMPAGAHDTLMNDNTDNVYRGYVGKQGNRVVPWVRTIYIRQLQCVRFQIDSQHTDLEMVVISPNPSKRYRNDNGAAPNPCVSGGTTCPIIRIPETGFASGYYTVHVSPKDGQALEGEFLLHVTVKPFGDVTPGVCSPATPLF
jgi:hypothetical protein